MRAPWAGIFTNVHVWALIFTSIGHDWGLFTILTDLPVYMSEVLKFRIKENGLLSALPYVFMWLVAIVSALIADYLISRNKCSVTAVRKTFTAVGKLKACFRRVICHYGPKGENCHILAQMYV